MNDVQPPLDTGRESGSPTVASRWRVVGAFCVGALLMVALSVPAVFVPGTRIGATVAAALIAGALAARERRWPARAGMGVAMGAALALAVSATALLLARDEPDAALWQAITQEVVSHSMIEPLDELLASWLGGFEQIEEYLLLARFAVSNLVMGLSGGLLGGLLATGSAPGRGELQGTKKDAMEQPPDGVEDGEEPKDVLDDPPSSEDEKVKDRRS